MEPRILLSGSDESRTNYEQAVIAAGGVPFSCYCPPCSLDFDGLLLCGGGDVSPDRFGQPDRGSADIDPCRDEAEFTLCAAWLTAGKPILGICRGQQVLNVALGGTLIQDIGSELCQFHCHDSTHKGDRVHPVRTAAGSLLRQWYGPSLAVTSSHHQAVDKLGACLHATAWSEGGLAEALEHESLPVLGVQFHPERMSYAKLRPDAADGSAIFTWFINQCKGTIN